MSHKAVELNMFIWGRLLGYNGFVVGSKSKRRTGYGDFKKELFGRLWECAILAVSRYPWRRRSP